MKRFSMRVCVLVFGCLAGLAMCRADELAAVTGLITDPNGRSVPGVTVLITNLSTNVVSKTVTNDQGIYRVPSLQPGIYRMTVDKDGFKSIVKSGIELHVQDVASINFELQIGSVNETVTVEAGGLVINTIDAAVSTVVDRQFAENLPLNGRSFQTLIELTPGVVLTPSNSGDAGQFSVNGQRAASNYWTVDGVSANIGLGVSFAGNPGDGLAGGVGSFSAQGGTNSLVSVDAMQEFRIQTSTYAPEFGRTPGGQISIVTRSGTNQFHGTIFDYLRNDALDANNWFNTSVTPALPKAKERQNDFGGTFSGPIRKDRTFFFFSYEGLRLRLPQTALTTVPDLAVRQSAVPAMQPFLNSYPLPNGPDNVATGVAQFNASYSDPSTLDAYSLRVDHKLASKLTLFGRYNYSPSEVVQRGGNLSLSTVSPVRITTQTGTVGTTWLMSPSMANDLRFNYSRVSAFGSSFLDNLGGAVPLASLPFPASFTSENAQLRILIAGLTQGGERFGSFLGNRQRQINLVDGMSLQKSSHSLKFGFDFRRLSPVYDPLVYSQSATFLNTTSARNGTPLVNFIGTNVGATFLFRNLGLYAQDTWKIAPRVTVTYGLRWDLDFVPKSLDGPGFSAATGVNLNDLSQLALAPAGTPPFKTTYGNIAPRIGVAYQLRHNQDRQSIVRGGFGVFYDLATSEMGNLTSAYPFAGSRLVFGSTFPLNPAAAAPPAITPPNASPSSIFLAVDPSLRLPYTLQWNVAIEQSLGRQQVISASYVGAAGRRLLQTALVKSPNPSLANAELVTNGSTSDYEALQLQFQRRLSRGLQVLSSYSWAHSIDTGSAGSIVVRSNIPAGSNPNANRAPSDFDIRHAFSAAITYDLPAPKGNAFAKAILGGWSTQNIFQAQSARPVEIIDALFANTSLNGTQADIHPDLVPGQPLYLFGPQYPGGKAFNPAAFTHPPNSGGVLLRQGNVPRNFLRGFGVAQWDFATHRTFPIRESLQLQLRAEMFNVLNHPNFGPPGGFFGFGSFGVATQLFGQSLVGASGANAGALSPLYQVGGPRSIQFGLKLMF